MVSNLRRLAADHAALHSKLPPYYILPPDDSHFTAADDLSQLTVLLTGPPGTPYSEGLWRLYLKMPQDYPNSPPKATFRTRIWHPNVEEMTGAVCVDTLKRDWQSTLTLRDVLITISCLLIHPNPDSALNSTAGNLLREEYNAFAHQAKLMTSIHAPIQSDLRALVNEAKSRGEDPSSVPQKADPHYQRPRKQQRTQGSASRNTGPQHSRPEYVLHPPRDIPNPQPILEDDQMQISDSDDENDDLTSASKENNPSFSPAPMRIAPSIGIRKNAFGKRPLSVLSMVYPEDPDTEMMIVDPESDNEKDSEASTTTSFSSSDQNIAANIPSSSTTFSRYTPKSPPMTPYRKTPRLAPSRRANTPTRLREDVQIYEDVPDRTLTDISRRFGRDGKENCDAVTGSYGVKGLRGLHAEKVAQAGNHIAIQSGTAYSATQSLMPSNTSPLKTSKKIVGGARRGPMTKTKPRIGVRRL
ncbi:Ubiquitin-conjugating enzyme E2 [Penicillium herquei]|nr:Ubiquitin-conjugating enzyme E2 [Penicillium herquei]